LIGEDNSIDFLEIWDDYSSEEKTPPKPVRRILKKREVRDGMIRPGVKGNLVAAQTLIKKERYKEALIRLERVLTEDPDQREALFRSALVRKHLGMLDEALRALNRLIELEPDFAGLRYERGACHFEMKNWDQAMEEFEVYVHLAGDNPDEKRFVKKALKLHAEARKKYSS